MDGVRRRLAPIRGIPTKAHAGGGAGRMGCGWATQQLWAGAHVQRRADPAASSFLPPMPQSGGMQDPNADLAEIFDTIESLPTAPKRLLDGFGRWLSGKDDPDWKR